ncbi:hypothetical protein Ddye_019606 [Dipteronia dyeriana]|uniref:Ubiquitin-like domain-containing protein n=1 Tax=Dipteronia dyeriana TaxID=168575 RepID=A0AAD9TYB3_9ROSI|nr:hypothetical protein Ddye_019606 [Dipteronia dyeriana]
MDVIFEPQRGGGRSPFSIEVGFFDTVLEIKEKIQKYHGIPITKQTLVFNGHVLLDDRDVENCEILHNSHIQLLVAESEKPPPPLITTTKNNNKIHLKINMPNSSKTHPQLFLDMEVTDSILRLKEKIHEMEAVPVNRLVVVQSNGGGCSTELQDHISLRECELVDNSEIDVNIKPSPTNSGTGSIGQQQQTTGMTMGTWAKKLRVMVLPKCGNKKIAVDVNASDNVGELRKELQKLHQRLHFHLPQEGYFFIYKQNVMDDDQSFRWHHVNQGDTIEIFNGSVTGGS